MTPNKKSRPPVKRKKSNKTLLAAIAIFVIVVIAVGAFAFLGNQGNEPSNPTPTPSIPPGSSPTPDPNYVGATKVLLETSVGNITIELRTDKPITSGNFENLVRQGLYDGTIFHRVIAGFMIQGGMITSQTIPTINDEIGQNNRNAAYTIAMAKTSNPNSATSQFFINVVDNGNNPIDQAGTRFDQVYTAFGRVIEGKNVVDAIANAPVTANPYTQENSQPITPVTLIRATLIS
jgi:cyclophilin family peptidyl-prolyl cis-trans isomerase